MQVLHSTCQQIWKTQQWPQDWKRSAFIPISKKSESEVAQSCPTLGDPMDCSLPGSTVHGISRQEYWSGLPFLSPGDLPNPGIEPRSPILQTDALPSEPLGKPTVKPFSNFSSLELLVGEGNGNPLQCSCLENPRDGGAWWAAVYGVA